MTKDTNATSGAADLRTAAQAVVDRWDTPLWKDAPATAEYIGRLRAALATGQATAAQVAVPSGWNLVPTEPTQAMLDAVVTSMDDFLLGKEAEKQYREDWAAMLAAAPAQPAARQGVAQQEAQEPATVPRFNCWSTNEGDSWFDHPADSQAIYDCLGNDAKVGDEYELTAGWKSVTARYRITEVVGDGEEYEVECISHPHENSAPQPPTAQAAESVTEPAGVEEGDIDAVALARYKVVPAHESMIHRFAVVAGDGNQQLYLGREVECENMARKFAGAFLDGAFYQANITPPTQSADSVQEDAARYRWLRRWKGQEHEPPFTVQHEIDGTLWGGDLDAAIDEARKQGTTP